MGSANAVLKVYGDANYQAKSAIFNA
ncbi:uncharacterized protein G2W53_022688 [Senna tora]|uniref:Uncharacterized protein n=1 Tax=Senna tora TaxID=362788 RepID=A0A834TNC4_9FABA|nr:uncharacterized protein G2W53_022688 [Senna tora]